MEPNKNILNELVALQLIPLAKLRLKNDKAKIRLKEIKPTLNKKTGMICFLVRSFEWADYVFYINIYGRNFYNEFKYLEKLGCYKKTISTINK